MNRRKIIIFLCAFLSAFFAFPQFNYWFYGKNKVIDQAFSWEYVETPHFLIYYYNQTQPFVQKLSLAAEQAYDKLANFLNIQVNRKVPVIFYKTKIDFEQTNIIGYVPAGAIAFAQSSTYRLVIQGESSFAELSRTLTHELTHIFEYEILGRMTVGLQQPPDWMMEGFSDYAMDYWDPFSLLTVRDAVLNDNIPQMDKRGDLVTTSGTSRTAYDFGHIVYEFVEKKFGKTGVKKLLNSIRRASIFGYKRHRMENLFNYTSKEFNFEFGKYARQRFRQFMAKETPQDYSLLIGPDYPFYYSLSHKVSPSGEIIAVLTANTRNYDLDIILISAKTGKVIKNITPGYTAKYDTINIRFNPTDGPSFSWSHDNDSIAFFARRQYSTYLVIVDVLSGQIRRTVKAGKFQDPCSPVFSKNDQALFFTALDRTQSNIYRYDLKSGQFNQQTSGRLFIRSITLSPDGTQMAYSAMQGDYCKLFLAPAENLDQPKLLTKGSYNDISPEFSLDGQRIYYSSDELQSYNICSLDLKTYEFNRYSDVKTGNFFPVPVPQSDNQLIISSYYKGLFQLYRLDISRSQETRQLEAPSELIAFFKPEEDIGKELPFTLTLKGKYRPLSKIFLRELPPIELGVASNSQFLGYTSLNLTDLMGDYTFSLTLASFYGYRSFHLVTVDQKKRFQPYFHIFSTKYPYYYVNDTLVREAYGLQAGFYYAFSTYYRAEITLSAFQQKDWIGVEGPSGTTYPIKTLFKGKAIPFSVALVGDTIRFTEYGPNYGHTFRLAVKQFIPVSNKFLHSTIFEADLRKYVRLDNYTLFAFRFDFYKATGRDAFAAWAGGDNTIRSADFNEVVGQNVFFFNAEFRFPIVHLALTPIGVIGPLRGTFFFDLGGGWFNEEKFRLFVPGKFQLQDPWASYGFGLQFFLFGYPLHFDWVHRTDFKTSHSSGLKFWIGFDF